MIITLLYITQKVKFNGTVEKFVPFLGSLPNASGSILFCNGLGKFAGMTCQLVQFLFLTRTYFSLIDLQV